MSESKGNQAFVGFSFGEMAQQNDPMDLRDTIAGDCGKTLGTGFSSALFYTVEGIFTKTVKNFIW